MDAASTVCTPLLAGDGRLRAQGDDQPFRGLWPTSAGQPSEVLADHHTVPLGPDVPPGEYRLLAGMYLLDTMERLAVAGDASGENAVTLGFITVKSE